MSILGIAERPLRVALVGTGPSGFYAAESLLKSTISVTIDAFDRLPNPFGLLRGGVAPDHQRMKSVSKAYERIALNPAFSFWGNVQIGKDLSVEELKQYYDVIIFACGCETSKQLGIPGELLPGSCAATEFVGWYNGHPDYRECQFDLSSESVVIIGQGNVAVDVARILAKTPEELKGSDIAHHAEAALAGSQVKTIHMIGRRGPAHVAFTELEIKELGELTDAEVILDPEVMKLDVASQRILEDPANNKVRKSFEVLQELVSRPRQNKPRQIVIRFYETPIEILGPDRVTGVKVQKNMLSGNPKNPELVPSGQTEVIPCGLVFRSIGYRGVPMPGVPFDDKKGIFRNQAGRITDEKDGVVPGLYVVGWIKRGPSGVIGSNKPDSASTVENVVADSSSLTPCPTPDSQAVAALLRKRGVRVVTFSDWQKIDAAETERGKSAGKPREKFVSSEEMLGVLG